MGSSLYQLWEECMQMLTSTQDQTPLSQDEMDRAMKTILSVENRHIPDYNKPSGMNLRRTGDNYKKREYKPPQLEKMKPHIQEDYDPLVRLNRKGQPREDSERYSWKQLEGDLKLTRDDEEDEADLTALKIFRRCLLLYLISELIMGNFVHAHLVTQTHVFFSWDDLQWFLDEFQRLVIDPPRARQMSLDEFRDLFHRFVKEIMKLLEKGEKGIGDSWSNARKHLLDKRWGAEFEVKPAARVDKSNLSATPKPRHEPRVTQDPSPHKTEKPKGGKGKGKGGKGDGTRLPPNPNEVLKRIDKKDKSNIKNDRYIKSASGRFYCKAKNCGKNCFDGKGQWHDRTCKDLHECSYIYCKNPQKCPGAYNH